MPFKASYALKDISDINDSPFHDFPVFLQKQLRNPLLQFQKALAYLSACGRIASHEQLKGHDQRLNVKPRRLCKGIARVVCSLLLCFVLLFAQHSLLPVFLITLLLLSFLPVIPMPTSIHVVAWEIEHP